MDYDRNSKYMTDLSSDPYSEQRAKKSYIDLGIDKQTLSIFVKMVISSNKMIRRSNLLNIETFLNLINPTVYVNDPDKSKMISFIHKGIEARLVMNLDDPYMIMQHINGGIITGDIIDLDRYQELSSAEVDFVNNMVAESLKYATIYKFADQMIDVCTRFKTQDYGSKGDIVKEFEAKVNEVQNEFRRNRNEDHTEMMFSLQPDQFEDVIKETYKRAANPKKKLSTGMQGMNEMLGGGFESGRIYIYFGLPGEGKSSVVLNLMYQIKKYNRDFQCKDPTKRPCVVLLTMENTVEESIERLFSMSTDRDCMTDFDVDSVMTMLKEDGELTLNDRNPIDIIIKYKPTNSVDTGYMYTLCDDLEDQGYEVIAFFQDYIGRIRSSQHLSDTRLEYGAVTDDFKVFAQNKDIPVISVSQLNRDASKRIDDGRQSNKMDLVRALGRSNISESMLVLNNIDCGFMITPEYSSIGEKFLGIQRVKIRYKASDLDVMYLPYSNNSGIKLLEDFGKSPIYKTTLRNGPTMIGNDPKFEDLPTIEDLKNNDMHSSIFSTAVNSSSVDSISDLDVAFERVDYRMMMNNLVDPLIYCGNVKQPVYIDPIVLIPK